MMEAMNGIPSPRDEGDRPRIIMKTAERWDAATAYTADASAAYAACADEGDEAMKDIPSQLPHWPFEPDYMMWIRYEGQRFPLNAPHGILVKVSPKKCDKNCQQGHWQCQQQGHGRGHEQSQHHKPLIFVATGIYSDGTLISGHGNVHGMNAEPYKFCDIDAFCIICDPSKCEGV